MKFRYLKPYRIMTFTSFLNGSTLGWLLMPLAFAALGADAGRTNNAPGKLSFSDFSIVSDRNIFNARRYPRSTATVVRSDTSRVVRTEYFALLGIISYEKGPFAFFDGSSSSSRKSATVNDEISGFKIKAVLPAAVELESGTNCITLPLGKQLCRPASGGQWQVADRTETVYASNDRRSDDRSFGNRDRDRDRRDFSSRDQERGNDRGGFEPPSVMIMQPGGEGSAIITLPNGELPQPTVEGVTIQIQGTLPGTAPPAGDGAENDVLRRLMQRREQELNR